MIAELSKTVHLAQADLTDTTARLTAIESQLGSDLAELRGMHDAASGDSALRRTAAEIDGDLRHSAPPSRPTGNCSACSKSRWAIPAGCWPSPPGCWIRNRP